jgi:hypothetical protein
MRAGRLSVLNKSGARTLTSSVDSLVSVPIRGIPSDIDSLAVHIRVPMARRVPRTLSADIPALDERSSAISAGET